LPCERPGCGHRMKLIRYISFVDYPGPDILMATMFNSAAVLDSALLLIAGTETCVSDFRASSRDYETREHHHFSEYSGLLPSIKRAYESLVNARYQLMSGYSTHWGLGTVAENSPISARLKYNIPRTVIMLTECKTFQDLNHGIKNVFSSQVLGWMRTPREILHLVLMCRQPESRMEFVNSRWCGNLFGIERPSKPRSLF